MEVCVLKESFSNSLFLQDNSDCIVANKGRDKIERYIIIRTDQYGQTV